MLTNGAKKQVLSMCRYMCESRCSFFHELVQTPTHRGLGRHRAWSNKLKKNTLRHHANLLLILIDHWLCPNVQAVGYFQLLSHQNTFSFLGTLRCLKILKNNNKQKNNSTKIAR